jgi:hypothetical protein
MGGGAMGTTGTMTDSAGAMAVDSTAAGMAGRDTTKKY